MKIENSSVSDYTKWVPSMCFGRTDKRSAAAPRPAFAFGDAGKKGKYGVEKLYNELKSLYN